MKRQFLRASVIVVSLLFAVTVYADIIGDLKKDLSPSQTNLSLGKPIETIVAEAIDAGADPVLVVRVAISLRPNLAAIIVNAAIKKRPNLAVVILTAALESRGVDAASVVTAAVTAMTGDTKAITDLRFAALEAGVLQNVVDQAVGTALGAPAGPVPASPTLGPGEHGGFGGGSGGGQGPVTSPWR